LVVEGRDEDDGLEREVMPLAIVDGVAGAWGL
jgi:hypothetical protein